MKCVHIVLVLISICLFSQANEASLVVNFNHMASVEQVLAYFLPEAPLEMLTILDASAHQLVLQLYSSFHSLFFILFLFFDSYALINGTLWKPNFCSKLHCWKANAKI